MGKDSIFPGSLFEAAIVGRADAGEIVVEKDRPNRPDSASLQDLTKGRVFVLVAPPEQVAEQAGPRKATYKLIWTRVILRTIRRVNFRSYAAGGPG